MRSFVTERERERTLERLAGFTLALRKNARAR
jgi:hypothetical protein